MNKKNLFLWSLYDFANSLVFITFVLYFSQWLVVEGGLSDFWYNATFAISTALLLLSAPFLAAHVDRHGGRKFFLNVSTVGTAISYTFAALLAYGVEPNIFLITLLFLAGQYFYQFSFVFYNAMLEDVAEPTQRTRASGIGYFANFLGEISGLVLGLIFVSSRLAPLIPSIIIFFILALPMMIFFKEGRASTLALRQFAEAGKDTKIFIKKSVAFFALSASVPMLASYFFFNDALVTLTNNYGIYLEQVFRAPDTQKNLLLMAVLVTAAIGSAVVAWIGNRIDALRQLKTILLVGVVVLPLLALAPTFAVFAILTIPVGFLIGTTFAVSRAYMSSLLSKEDMTYGFSFYTLAERFATFVGPLTWGTIILIMGNGSTSYRIAAAAMGGFVLVGLLVLLFFRKSQPKTA